MWPIYHPRSVPSIWLLHHTFQTLALDKVSAGVTVPRVRFRIVKEDDTLAKLSERGEFVVDSYQRAPILGDIESVSASL